MLFVPIINTTFDRWCAKIPVHLTRLRYRYASNFYVMRRKALEGKKI